MKSLIIIIGTSVLLAFGATTFIGCGGGAEQEATEAATEGVNEEAAEAQYQCPMDCEEGKTYSEAGICPVCKMDLEELG